MGGLLGYPLGEKGSIVSGGNADDYTKSGIYAVNAVGGSTTISLKIHLLEYWLFLSQLIIQQMEGLQFYNFIQIII